MSVQKPRVHHRKGRKRGRIFHLPRMLVRCACCEGKLEIFHDCPITGYLDADTLEINGVIATIEQWREILLPLLQMEVPEEKRVFFN